MAAAEAVLIRDLAVVMVAAAGVSLLFHRFRQPAVLGHLAAGVLVGPHLLPWPLIQDAESIATLAQLGTVFLLFGLGLQFEMPRLRRVAGPVVLAGLLAPAVLIALAAPAARSFGWGPLDGLFLGVAVSVAGASVVLRLLEDAGLDDAPEGQVVQGLLVFEKFTVVVLMGALSSFALTGTFQAGALPGVVARVVLFTVTALVLGLLLVPRVLRMVLRVRSDETLVITVLGVAFGLAVLAEGLGIGLALGAFIGGAVVAGAGARSLVLARVTPMRDAFVAVFLVAMGLQVDPGALAGLWVPVLLLSGLVLAGKTLAVGAATFVAGYAPAASLRAGLPMAALGGFGLVVMDQGRGLGVLHPDLFPVMAGVTAVTAFAAPVLVRRSDALTALLGRALPRRARGHLRSYADWLARHRGPLHGGVLPRGALHPLGRGVVYASLLVALVVALGGAQARIATLPVDRPLVRDALVVVAWAAFAMLAVPVAWGLVRAVRDLVGNVVDALVPWSLRAEGATVAVERVLRTTLYGFAALVAATVAFAAGGLLLPPLPLLAVGALVAAAAGLQFRASLRRLDAEVDATLRAIVRGTPVHGGADALLEALQERYGGAFAYTTEVVPRGAPVAHLALRDAALPRRTGALVVTHEREGVRTVNPPPSTVLEPGDRIGIVGTTDELEATRRLLDPARAALSADGPAAWAGLRAGATPPAAQAVREVALPATSPLAGAPLAEARLRETTGVMVLAMLRGGQPDPSPRGDKLLQPGDVLVLLGTEDQLAAAEARLAGR